MNNSQYVDISENLSYTNDGSNNKFIAELNPFRYRGYYYDIETGLYYLNSRYYDPEIGRFINADDIATLNITNTAINGLNLYAYCLNNPVNERDDSGYFLLWLFITAIVVGAIISAGVEIVSQGISNGWDNINWGQVGWSALMGGIGGALTISGLGVLGMTIAGAGLGLVSSVGSNIIGGSDFTDWHTWANIGLSTGLGALFGYLGGTGSRNAIGLDNAVKKSHQFTKAALSYDKVLTKIANGSYKNLAGAAGARAITSKALQATWQTAVIKTAWRTFAGSVKYTIIQNILNLVKF